MATISFPPFPSQIQSPYPPSNFPSPFPPIPLMLPFALLLLPFAAAAAYQVGYFPPDAVALLSFKAKADLDNRLLYALDDPFDYCQWRGVKCAQGRVVRFVAAGFSLRGVFAPASLSCLDQLRVLDLHNNSLSGPVPDLSALVNLKSLFLGRNSFSGSFPASILFLHTLVVLDLSYNNLSGPIPVKLLGLDRLNTLRLERNQFNGALPPLNQSFLVFFNVSGNNLAGPIPLTPTLSKFDWSSFSSNLDLCGEIVFKACSTVHSHDSPSSSNGAVSSPRNHKRTTAVFSFAFGISTLILSIVCISIVLIRKQRKQTQLEDKQPVDSLENSFYTNSATQFHTMRAYREIVTQQGRKSVKSGSLVFCGAEIQEFTVEELMRASAEFLGRGTIGTTYKAILDDELIVTVKRIDASKTAVTSADEFERHMEVVGGLRHPNLVPITAYFQGKGERLVVYDYQPNGSLFNLIHGSRSKPLHLTTCLKIAEDVAQGLAYIHHVSKLVHGNLKSSNILIGPDFELRITDYCLASLASTGPTKAPKSDVYSYGKLLLELLSGKQPSQHPYLGPTDTLEWVRAVRGDDGADDTQLGMLTELTSMCSSTAPEQRPEMWEVLKMIREIRECVAVEDDSGPGYS